MNPPCKAANCLRVSWSRGLCQPCYTAANKRRAQLQDGGLPRDVSWRRAINELASPTPLPAIQLLDPKREQDYADLASETAEVCDILGVDRTVDYDLVQVARAVVAERDRLQAVITATTEALGDLNNATGARTLPDAVAGLSRLWLAADLELEGLRANLEERRREVETLGRMSADWRNQFEAEEKRHAETFGRLTAEADKVKELTETLLTVEAKLSSADAENGKLAKQFDGVFETLRMESADGPGRSPVRIEWEADSDGDMLCLYAFHYRINIATIDSDATGCALKLLRWVEGETQAIKAKDRPEATVIITALLALRGITVPPYPEQS